MQEFQEFVTADMVRVNKAILKQVENTNPLIVQITNHLVNSGGKRLRPALTLACANLCGYAGERHVNLAAVVEFIHTATLLHDDVVDESKMRRGSPTANEKWGNKASVLVGDFLLSRSFQMMVSDGSLEVLELLSDSAAIISEGEVKQLSIISDPMAKIEDYYDVIKGKTAKLFSAASEIAAIITEQKEHQKNLSEFGMNLGMAFQIVDDALDYNSNAQDLGKNIGDDFKEKKITLPIIIAIEVADDAQKKLMQDLFSREDESMEGFEEVLKIMQEHDVIKKCADIAQNFVNYAKENLNKFKDSKAKKALIELCDFSVARAY